MALTQNVSQLGKERHDTHARRCVGKGTTRRNERTFDHGKRPSGWRATDTSVQQVLKELLICTSAKELVESSKFDGFASGLLQSKGGVETHRILPGKLGRGQRASEKWSTFLMGVQCSMCPSMTRYTDRSCALKTQRIPTKLGGIVGLDGAYRSVQTDPETVQRLWRYDQL